MTVSRLRFSVGVGVLAAILGSGPAGALTGPPAPAPAGTEDLCPATDPLVGSVQGADQQISLLRSFFGCRVSDDPGPADPGGG